ncbi:MAG: Xaa-Pro peptidase family protein [Capsulimonadales bacterium]|nr:Xaa-Pro peptidase family protein [Capsulimonadales bacterium]
MLSEFRFPHRTATLRRLLSETEHPVDAMLVTNIENARYLTGFTGSNAAVLITPDDAVFITDGRYTLQASTEVTGFRHYIPAVGTRMEEAIVRQAKELGVRRIGIETDSMFLTSYQRLTGGLDGVSELIPRTDVLAALRRVKDDEEIGAIRRAIAAADDCFEHLRSFIRPGLTERDIAWEIEVFLRRERGASKLGFDPIIGSGPNSALIHGRPGDRVVGSSGGTEFVLCDYGCTIDGYNSDITRTFFVGGEPTKQQAEMYSLVRQALEIATAAIRPGMAGREIDKVARDFLTEAGYGEAFAHGLGHGLGRLVHDHPALGTTSEVTLEPGMVLTVEPGIYLEGVGGVRIEDNVLVTEAGCEVLTRSTKEPIILR